MRRAGDAAYAVVDPLVLPFHLPVHQTNQRTVATATNFASSCCRQGLSAPECHGHKNFWGNIPINKLSRQAALYTNRYLRLLMAWFKKRDDDCCHLDLCLHIMRTPG